MRADDIGVILLTGVGATIVTDIWSVMRKSVFAVPLPNFGLVGRWIAHLTHGRFRHDSIAAAPPVRGESAIGWSAHYLIGIAFAFLLPVLWGVEWLRHPSIGPALIVGIGTVTAPFFVMQPAMGTGIAASRTPRPATARFHSLVLHLIYGLGLYVTTRVIGYLSAGG